MRGVRPAAANPYQPPQSPEGEVNLTDPDFPLMRGFRSYIQGYNAQVGLLLGDADGQAEVADELRARVCSWPPLRQPCQCAGFCCGSPMWEHGWSTPCLHQHRNALETGS